MDYFTSQMSNPPTTAVILPPPPALIAGHPNSDSNRTVPTEKVISPNVSASSKKDKRPQIDNRKLAAPEKPSYVNKPNVSTGGHATGSSGGRSRDNSSTTEQSGNQKMKPQQRLDKQKSGKK